MTKEEEAIKWLGVELHTWEIECKSEHPVKDALKVAIETLKQKSKTGYWIEHQHEWGDNWDRSRYECSACHNWAYFDDDFCPNCGLKMVEH